MKEVVMLGEVETGKTTLANALLGWDFFPQSNEGWYMPTKVSVSRMLTDQLRLTDTPGYDSRWKEVPEELLRAVSRADILIALVSQTLAEEDTEFDVEDPEWDAFRQAEDAMLKELLAKGNTRDIFFVIPYDSGDWPEGQVPLGPALRMAKSRLASMTDYGERGIFCVDPMMALVGEIEADRDAVARSGLSALKDALLRTGGAEHESE